MPHPCFAYLQRLKMFYVYLRYTRYPKWDISGNLDNFSEKVVKIRKYKTDVKYRKLTWLVKNTNTNDRSIKNSIKLNVKTKVTKINKTCFLANYSFCILKRISTRYTLCGTFKIFLFFFFLYI